MSKHRRTLDRALSSSWYAVSLTAMLTYFALRLFTRFGYDALFYGFSMMMSFDALMRHRRIERRQRQQIEHPR